MINTSRLQILVDLRRSHRPRISQKAAATLLGLDSNQGRKTVGDWELGKYAPNEPKRRAAFIGYLWDSLELRRDPEQFEAIWQIFVEEWEWQPIADEEWRGFTNVPRPGRSVMEVVATVQLPVPEPKLVPDTRGFIGRKEELEQFAQQLAVDNCAILTGPTGVGKTALAARLATQAATNDRIFWHICYPAHDVNAFIWELAEFLAWRGETEIWQMLNTAMQSGAMPPAQTILEYLFRTLRGQDILLCLDDFHVLYTDPRQQGLIERLKTAADDGEVKLIVTAQQTVDLGAGSAKPLDGLSYSDTSRLLNTQGVPLPEGVLQQLYESTEGNAELLILSIQSLRKTADPEALIQRLIKTEQVKQFLLEEVDQTLQDEERMVMYGVAALLGYPGTADAIEEVLDSSGVRYTLTYLVNRYLLEEGISDEMGDATYRQHAIVQTFYYELLGRHQKKAMHLRAAEYYEDENHDPFQAALHYQHAQKLEKAAQLVTIDIMANLHCGRAQPLQKMLERFKKQQLSPILWGAVLVGIGEAMSYQEEWRKAIQKYEEAYDHLENEPRTREVRQLQVKACRGAAIVLRSRTPEDALPWLEKGLALSEDLDPVIIADLHIQTGVVHSKMDKRQSMIEHCTRGLSMVHDLPSSPRTNRVRVLGLNNLAIGYFFLNNLDQAEAFWEEARVIAQDGNDPLNLLALELNLASLSHAREEWHKAQERYEKAMVSAKKLGNVLELARLKSNLAVLFLDTHRIEAARVLLQEAYKLAKQIEQAEVYLVSIIYLGDVALRTQSLTEAKSYLEDATRQVSKGSFSYQLPTINTLWAEYYLQKGILDKALMHAERAIESAQRYEVKVAEEKALAMLEKVQAAASLS